MKKKSDKHIIRPDTCAKCNNGQIVPTEKGNPRLVYCSFFNRRFCGRQQKKLYSCVLNLWTDIH